VLLNLSMPNMTGWDVIAVMRRDVRLALTPVVLLSGIDPQLSAHKHKTIAAYLRKPYDSAQLLAVVAEHARVPGDVA
jgi:CheY-like chemotaxis protein